MKQHEYQITVQHVKDANGQASTYAEALQFQAFNHDDIFEVLQRVKDANLLDEESAKAFAVGLKLFGEVLLENKDVPMFKAFFPDFLQFMKALKQQVKNQQDVRG
jgi:hypothetical protein